MISMQHVKRFCNTDICLIENYTKAIADTTQTWHCHHRLEIQDDKILSREELKSLKLYYNRPAKELIFLPEREHRSLHGKYKTLEQRMKLSKANSGENNPMFGKRHTEEAKRRVSEANKGKKRSLEIKQRMSMMRKGIPRSEEVKQKIAESVKRTKQLKKQQKELLK